MPDLNRVLPNINHSESDFPCPSQNWREKCLEHSCTFAKICLRSVYPEKMAWVILEKRGKRWVAKSRRRGAIKPTGCNSFWQRCFLLCGTRYAQPLTANLFISNKIFAIGVHFCPNSTSTRHGINSEFCPNSTFPGNDLSLMLICICCY